MKKLLISLICVLLFCSACAGTKPPEKVNELEKVKETKKFVYYCSAQDSKIADDMNKVLEERYPEICRDLEYEYTNKISIEIYPDQKSYDSSPSRIGDAGFPAVSGNGKIQMVSPKSPIVITGISYNERLLMAVHEFAHLMVNGINQDAPMWLQEGTASYEGSKEGYEKIIFDNMGKVPQFSFNELEHSYYDQKSSDVYSYFAVKYIVEKYGYGKLSKILRKPDDFEEILEITKDEFGDSLNSYIQLRNQTAEKS